MVRADPLAPFSPPPMASSLSSSFSSAAFASAPAAYDPSLDLSRLLNRLEQNLLRADSDRWRRLVADEFQRQQARYDVAVARKLLTRAEQDALAIKVHTRRQESQAVLNRQRALVEQLQERLDDLEGEARAAEAAMDTEGGEDDEADDDDDDVLAQITKMTRTEQLESSAQGVPEAIRGEIYEEANEGAVTEDMAMSSSFSTADASSETKPARSRRKKTSRTVRIPPTVTATEASAAAPTATATVRLRKGKKRSSMGDTARSTSAQIDDGDYGDNDNDNDGKTEADLASSSLLLGRSSSNTAGDPVASEETVLDDHRREQEALSEDILRLAQALKEKSLATSRLLEDDKGVVDRVGDGMSTTTDSLSAASRSMAVLTRMTEGKGWWGRMLLLGMVYGLMALLVLLFLFLPKLRL